MKNLLLFWPKYTTVKVCNFVDREGFYLKNLDENVVLLSVNFETIYEAVRFANLNDWVIKFDGIDLLDI